MTAYTKGSVFWNDLSISNFDGSQSTSLGGTVLEMRIIEDLFCSVVKGSMRIREGIGLFTGFPLVGEETLNVDFQIFQDDAAPHYKKKFAVYHVSDFEWDKISKAQGYVYSLDFCSKELFKSESTSINFGYKDVSASQIVADIYTNHMMTDPTKSMLIEKTAKAQNIVFPSITPIQAINMVSTYADSAESNGNNYYLFYEDKDGFNFINYYTLCRQDSSFSYVFKADAAFSPLEDGPSSLSIPISFKLVKVPNKLDLHSTGAFASTIIGVDEITRQITPNEFSYANEFDRRPQLDDSAYSLLSSSWEYKTSNVTKVVSAAIKRANSAYHNKFAAQQIYSKSYDIGLGKRLSAMAGFDALEMILVVPGNLGLTVGRIVHVDVPEVTIGATSDGTSGIRRLTGKYMIKQVAHVFAGNKYFMELRLTRDSFVDIIHV